MPGIERLIPSKEGAGASGKLFQNWLEEELIRAEALEIANLRISNSLTMTSQKTERKRNRNCKVQRKSG